MTAWSSNKGTRGLSKSKNKQQQNVKNTVYDDTCRNYYITIKENSKTRKEFFSGTIWQLKEYEMNFYESKGLDYKGYLRQSRYSFVPYEAHDYRGIYWRDMKDIITEGKSEEDRKGALKAYQAQKKEFIEKRYKKR